MFIKENSFMNRKKIAIVHNSMYMGGSQRVLLNLLNELDYNLVEVDLFLLAKDDDLLNLIPKEVSVSFCKNYCNLEYLKKTIHSKNVFKVLICFIYIVLEKILPESCFLHYAIHRMDLKSKETYDVICNYQGGLFLTLIVSLFQLKGKKRFAWIHGDIKKQVPECLLKKNDKIFCVSKGIKKIFESNYPNCVNKTDVLYNLLDIKGIDRKSDNNVDCFDFQHISLVSVGRISPEKGFQMIPKIAQLLLNDGYSFNWYLLGDGILKEDIISECKKLNISNSVHCLGQTDNPYPYIKNCTIYVQPSYTEGFCTATNEAKYLCKPVVVTNVSGMDEQFTNNENGIIVSETTPEAIYIGIKYLIDNPDIRNKFSESLKTSEFSNDELLHDFYQHCEITI